MAVPKRQGREKPAKIEQRKVKERSEDGVRTSGRTALLAEPNLHRAGPGGRKHIKGGAKCSLALSLPRVYPLSLSLSLSLFPPNPHPAHAGPLLHSLLFFEDGFSYYLLNKIEL